MGYDIIVVGGGHAGTEAALASARMGCTTLLITLRLDTLGTMSCNPAIGGVGKGQLVKEIDALGGEMAKAADFGGIQFRLLNSSKGPAVRSSRAQEDRKRYSHYMKGILESEENLSLKEAQVTKLLHKKETVEGIQTDEGEEISARVIIATPGTFLNGLMHVGLKSFPGGRIGENSATELSHCFRDLGFKMLRFKTGTCARLDGRTINFQKLQVQEGDKYPYPFSFSTNHLPQKQVPCYLTYTNKKTHQIIRSGLDRSPLYTGIITGTGVRYCPSIEDKVVRFTHRERHQIFLEPEGLDTSEFYPNGLATSLPEDVQMDFLHSIKGLEEVKPTRMGYGIEHDVVQPTQLYPTLETKLVKNLYLAGQINGTTGYEEAATQGLIAGINAARRVKKKQPLILDRATSYIGVLIDDLVTKGTNEPYRMFTSRVEYRLLLREDNADTRLRKIGYDLGLVKETDYRATLNKQKEIETTIHYFRKKRIKPTATLNAAFQQLNCSSLTRNVSLLELLKRPEITLEKLKALGLLEQQLAEQVGRSVEAEIKCAGYVRRQLAQVKQFRNLEKIKLPPALDYGNIPGLSIEIKEKLKKFKPLSLGQASRISGITPAAITVLMVYLKRVTRIFSAKAEKG